jgi:hypothetical protein
MADVVAYGVMALSLLLMACIVPRLIPRTAAWLLALLAIGSAALAVGFLWAYQWAGYTLLAYIDGITFGLFAVQAALALLIKRSTPGGERPVAEVGGESRAVE